MCQDPAASEAIKSLRADVAEDRERIDRLDSILNGDGSKEKGVLPRLASIESILKIMLWIMGTVATAAIGAAIKYIFA